MAIVYYIYANDGAGGPVNYTTPVATTTGLSYEPAALALSSNTTFAVRSFDNVTDLEDANTDCRVNVVLDASGNDISGRPSPPHAVVLSAAPAGGCLVSWAFSPTATSALPTGFQVYLTEGSTVDYTTPAATVAYARGQVGYTCPLPGPFTLTTYTASVRAYNGVDNDGNAETATATVGMPTTPLSMDAITVSFV